jgi:hypothetical protein
MGTFFSGGPRWSFAKSREDLPVLPPFRLCTDAHQERRIRQPRRLDQLRFVVGTG